MSNISPRTRSNSLPFSPVVSPPNSSPPKLARSHSFSAPQIIRTAIPDPSISNSLVSPTVQPKVTKTFCEKVKGVVKRIANWISSCRLFATNSQALQTLKTEAEKAVKIYLRPSTETSFRTVGNSPVSNPRFDSRIPLGEPLPKGNLLLKDSLLVLKKLFYKSPTTFAEIMAKNCRNERELNAILDQIPDKFFPFNGSKANVVAQVKTEIANTNPKVLNEVLFKAIMDPYGPKTQLQQKLLNNITKYWAPSKNGDSFTHFIKMCQSQGLDVESLKGKLDDPHVSKIIGAPNIDKIKKSIDEMTTIKKILSNKLDLQAQKELSRKMTALDVTSSKTEDLHSLSIESHEIYTILLNKLTIPQKEDIQKKIDMNQKNLIDLHVSEISKALTSNSTWVDIQKAFLSITDDASIKALSKEVTNNPNLKGLFFDKDKLIPLHEHFPKIYKGILDQADELTKKRMIEQVSESQTNQIKNIKSEIQKNITTPLLGLTGNLVGGTSLTAKSINNELNKILLDKRKADVFFEELKNNNALFQAVEDHFEQLREFAISGEGDSPKKSIPEYKQTFLKHLQTMPSGIINILDTCSDDTEATKKLSGKDLSSLFNASNEKIIKFRNNYPITYKELFYSKLTDIQQKELNKKLAFFSYKDFGGPGEPGDG